MPPPAARLTPRAEQILAAARGLLEEQGLEALSLRNLAERIGIRAPSIYKHFRSKEALEAALISIGFEEQGRLFAELEGADEPLIEMAAAYREYGHRHAQLYRLMYDRPIDRSLLFEGSEENAVAPVLQAAGGSRDLARAVWAFAHGMMILELSRRFPDDADLDAAWSRGMEALQASARTAPRARRRQARPPRPHADAGS